MTGDWRYSNEILSASFTYSLYDIISIHFARNKISERVASQSIWCLPVIPGLARSWGPRMSWRSQTPLNRSRDHWFQFLIRSFLIAADSSTSAEWSIPDQPGTALWWGMLGSQTCPGAGGTALWKPAHSRVKFPLCPARIHHWFNRLSDMDVLESWTQLK